MAGLVRAGGSLC